jgi:uncharacterized phage protein (TIGR01671 family)
MPKDVEVKYRAWDKKNKKMKRVISYSFEEQYVVFKYAPDKKVAFKDIELMQYMGMASESRKPICEGDIVTFKEDNEKETALVVHTEKGEWFFRIVGTDRDVIPWNVYNRPPKREIEIMGNKFENPDYLSKEYAETVKLWHMYDILSSHKICDQQFCRHDLRNVMERLSSRTKTELIEVIEKLADDLRHYKNSYFEEFSKNRR